MVFFNFAGRTYFLPALRLQQSIKERVESAGVKMEDVYIICQGRAIQSFEQLPNESTLEAKVRLVGGKGGYGAKLKTEGGKKVRPNDNMFSRDTHGRKIVYSTIEKDFIDFCKKKKAENQIVAKQLEKFKVMESTLKEGQSFMKLDKTYNLRMEQAEKNILEAIKVGQRHLSASVQSDKRPEVFQRLVDISEKEKKQPEPLQAKSLNILEEDALAPFKRLLEEQQRLKQEEPVKKVKVDLPDPVFKTFSSAKLKLKSLFKK